MGSRESAIGMGRDKTRRVGELRGSDPGSADSRRQIPGPRQQRQHDNHDDRPRHERRDPKTPEAAKAPRLALRLAAIKKGKKLDPRSLIAADFMILVTSLPAKGYKAKDILAVYRLRW